MFCCLTVPSNFLRNNSQYIFMEKCISKLSSKTIRLFFPEPHVLSSHMRLCSKASGRLQFTFASNHKQHKLHLTGGGLNKMATIFQTTFSNAFSWIKIVAFWWKFHWNLFPRVQLTTFQHWFRKWLGAGQATSHYLNQWWLILTMYRCVTLPKWVNRGVAWTKWPPSHGKHF